MIARSGYDSRQTGGKLASPRTRPPRQDKAIPHLRANPRKLHKPRRAAHKAAATAKVFIGTSGWTYDGWRGPFYPRDVPKTRWLAWYATRFATAEINGSFYRTPSLETVRGWRHQTPSGFVLAWKASKFITHWKRLSPKSANSIALMVARLEALGPKAGPVLFQLPPHFTADRDRLAAFLPLLPAAYRYAFEFRDGSWYNDAIFDLLHAHGCALCLSDHHEAPAPWEVTARHVYVRGHGPTGEYRDNYPDKTLRRWADAIAAWTRQRRTVYVYFDNDQKSAAPADARRLMELAGD
jgi:uncharacterized protein YecE (DUF72 family)